MQSAKALAWFEQGPSACALDCMYCGAAAATGAAAGAASLLDPRGPMKESTARWAIALPVPMAAPVTRDPMSPDIMPPPPLLWPIIPGAGADIAGAGGGAW